MPRTDRISEQIDISILRQNKGRQQNDKLKIDKRYLVFGYEKAVQFLRHSLSREQK